MKWSSAVSEKLVLRDAVAECASRVREELGDTSPDLIFVFVSAHHAMGYEEVPRLVREHISEGVLIGCSGGGIIGAGKEVEHRPGFAMTAAHLPGVELAGFHIDNNALPDGDAAPSEWAALVKTSPLKGPHFVLLADPFSLNGEHLLMGLDYAFPQSAKIGGLASGAHAPGGNALYLGDKTHKSGLVGVALQGNIEVDTVVAQGCRPIGAPMHITACDRNLLLELDGRTPFEALKGIFERLSERDRQLAQHSLFLGVVMDELKESPQLGDFLIRNIIGVDPRRGALAIGEMLKEGQTVQFHLRDADTSSEDLDMMLSQYVADRPAPDEAGALLFSCLGRGSYLYGRADHDTDMFRQKVGLMPLTGFFCNGEIGQVGGATYLHGYTSSFGIFRPKRRE
jgi:small ligand-binding sensory domain FIST